MSPKSLLLSVGSVSIVGTGIYAIYTLTQANNRRIEIPDVVNDLGYEWDTGSSNSTTQDKPIDNKK